MTAENIIERKMPELTPDCLGRGPIPIEPYISNDYFEREREKIFRKTWLCIGREEEIPSDGDFLVREIEILNASVLVVRQKGGALRAFHNVCSHRGNKLVWETEGSAKMFMCKYHHWTFGLSGDVRGIPDREMFFDLDKSACALSAIRVDLWEGFIFVNLASDTDQDLPTFLGGLGTKLTGYPFARFSAWSSMTGVFEANWKVAIDAFQEAYHVGALHKRTIGPQFTSSQNPFGRLISAEFFGPHRSGSVWGNRAFEPRPIETTIRSFNNFIVDDDDAGGEQPPFPASLNPRKDPNWAVEMNVFFPNLFLFASQQGYITHSFWPISCQKTRWEARTYFAPARTARQLFAQQSGVCAARDTFVEDGVNIDRSQAGLNSRAKPFIHFQDNEVFLRHQYVTTEEFVNRT